MVRLGAWARSVFGTLFLGSAVTLVTWAWGLYGLRNRPEDLGLPAIAESETEAAANPNSHLGSGERNGLDSAPRRGRHADWHLLFFVKFVRYALWSWAPYLLETKYGMKGNEAGYLSTLFDVGGF